MDLLETDILGEDIGSHWYYVSKSKFMLRALGAITPTEVLDVGAGSGYFAKCLLSETDAQRAVCVDPNYAGDWSETLGGKSLAYCGEIASTDADLVLLMDVLEHVTDDVALLREYVEKVTCGTRFLITVPAFGFLWSGHDEFLRHYRRYTLRQVRLVMKTAGLRVDQGFYCFGSVFPIAATTRLFGNLISRGDAPRSQLTRQGPVANAILKALCAAELPLFSANRIAGLSVLCLGHKE